MRQSERTLLCLISLACLAELSRGSRRPRGSLEEPRTSLGSDSRHITSHVSEPRRNGVMLEAISFRRTGKGKARGFSVFEKYDGRNNKTLVEACTQDPKSSDETLCRKIVRHPDGSTSVSETRLGTTVSQERKQENVNPQQIKPTSMPAVNAGGGIALGSPSGIKHRVSGAHDEQGKGRYQHGLALSDIRNRVSNVLDDSWHLAFDELANDASGEHQTEKQISVNMKLGEAL